MTAAGGDAGVDESWRAAMARWETIAKFAWSAYQAQGRGVVLVSRADLLAAGGEDASSGATALPMSFVPHGYVPSGDDFAAIIGRYDPRRQVALLVGDADGEQLLVLEPADVKRPGPPEC